MIDSKTKQKVIVEVDPEYGCFVRVSDWEVKDYLEDVLTEKYEIDCSIYLPEKDQSGKEVAYRLYLGSKFERMALQEIIDSVDGSI